MISRKNLDVIVPLEFLRGIAAAGVVAEHLLSRYERRGVLTSALPAFLRRLGETGVFAFFAISGFIMVHIALRRTIDMGNQASAWSFLRDRFARIAPLYYMTTALSVAFAYATSAYSTNTSYRAPGARDWALSLLFVPYRRIDDIIQPIYGLGWTLQYEMFFYVLFAGGLALGVRRGIPTVIAAICLLAMAGYWIGEPDQDVGLALLSYVYTRPVLLYFVIGMTLALVRHVRKAKLPTAPVAAISSAALVLFLVAAVEFGTGWQILLICGALATATLFRSHPHGAPTFSRFARATGNASYATYLTHSFILGAFASATSMLVGTGTAALIVAVSIACAGCLFAGWLAWRVIEYPVTTRLRRRPATVKEQVAP